jgi:hypothetical protein
MDEDPAITYRTLLKESSRSQCVLFDNRMANFTLNCHMVPNGLIDLVHLSKKPRPIYDCSFHPKVRTSGINDWTKKETEPPLYFEKSFMNDLTFLYNMRISYPTDEIYAADDDVSGAFRHRKYHPNLVAMHSCTVLGRMVCVTGSTFGGSTSPRYLPMRGSKWLNTFTRRTTQWLWLSHICRSSILRHHQR